MMSWPTWRLTREIMKGGNGFRNLMKLFESNNSNNNNNNNNNNNHNHNSNNNNIINNNQHEDRDHDNTKYNAYNHHDRAQDTVHHCQGTILAKKYIHGQGQQNYGKQFPIMISLRTQPFTPIETSLVGEKLETGRVLLGMLRICLKVLLFCWKSHPSLHEKIRWIWVLNILRVN